MCLVCFEIAENNKNCNKADILCFCVDIKHD